MPVTHRFLPDVKQDAQVVILDCGSKSTPLFAGLCREFALHSCTIDPFCLETHAARRMPKAIIIAGGPKSVYDADAVQIPWDILMRLHNEHGVKIFATCYGAQAIVHHAGGKVQQAATPEAGLYTLTVPSKPYRLSRWRSDLEKYDGRTVVMNHADDIVSLPSGREWEAWGSTERSRFALFGTNDMFCTLFHPELEQTAFGADLLRLFLFRMARCVEDYDNTPAAFVADAETFIQEAVPEGRAIVGVSGGVDSITTFELFRRALGRHRVWGIFVDNGFLREGEAEEIARLLGEDEHVIFAQARRRFYESVEAIPWMHRAEHLYFHDVRNAIGHAFADVFSAIAKTMPHIVALGQGTNQSDIRESETQFVQHHNLALTDELDLTVVEPLAGLHKHEIRRVAAYLALPEEIVWRQPSPGPGNAIRVPMPVTREKVFEVNTANRVLHQRIVHHFPDPRDRPSQYYVQLRPGKVRMLLGDQGRYGWILEVRAVKTVERENYASADTFFFPEHVLRDIDEHLRAEIRGPDGDPIAAVSLLLTPKPPLPVECQ